MSMCVRGCKIAEKEVVKKRRNLSITVVGDRHRCGVCI